MSLKVEINLNLRPVVLKKVDFFHAKAFMETWRALKHGAWAQDSASSANLMRIFM